MPGSPVVVRPIRDDEHVRVGDLLFAAYTAVGGEPDWYLARMRQTPKRAAAVPVLVAVDAEDTILGTVTYVPGPGTAYSDVEREGEAGIRAFAVASEARGRGIGRLLVDAVIERARTDGRRGIAIFTRPRMTAAHALYESMGFVRAPERDETFAPDEWLLAYRLPLDEG